MDFFRQFDFSAALMPFLLACLGTWACTFLSRHLAFRFSILAKPSARRRHERPTPLLGGLSIFIVLSGGLAGLLLFGKRAFSLPVSHQHAVIFLVALAIIFITGLVDDWLELKAPQKLAGELLAAALVLGTEDNLPVIFQNYGVPPWIGYGVALLWIIGVTNAMNLIDGLDGFCSGVAAVAAVGIFAMVPTWSVASFTVAVLAGASVGFFFHNFHPAKIFLGDSGSLLLGFALSSLALKIPFNGPLVLSMGVPAFLFGVPILDTFLAIYRRTTRSRSVFTGDRGHLHHRLQHLGLSPETAALVLIGLQAYSVLVSVVLFRSLPEWGWGAVLLATPVVVFFLGGLQFTEYLVSYQSARLSYHFLTDELESLEDRNRTVSFMRDQVERYETARTPFSVVIMDCSAYIHQIVSNHPTHLVTYFITLYGILKGRLRSTDLIARPSELEFAVILPGAELDETKDAVIFDFLRVELKKLQEEHGIFQGDAERPEGFTLLSYPRDRVKIARALRLTASRRIRRAA